MILTNVIACVLSVITLIPAVTEHSETICDIYDRIVAEGESHTAPDTPYFKIDSIENIEVQSCNEGDENQVFAVVDAWHVYISPDTGEIYRERALVYFRFANSEEASRFVADYVADRVGTLSGYMLELDGTSSYAVTQIHIKTEGK